ncbi:MAG: nucleotidyltransferase family protein [Dehalococcoidia bacterium]|nr:nucleotidyltransferase family protein [Dehalococcoidia bacterium]
MYALIVAGGEGQRLRPYTENRPKGMVEVNGKPLLEYQMGWLRDNGVTNVIILCGYKAEVITDYFKDGAEFGLRIEYGFEDQPMGRGGALKMGFTMLPASEDLIIGANGDNINDQRLALMIEFHRANNALATVMLTRLRSPYGIATLQENGQISGFEEKPLLPHWLNAGVYVFSRPVFALFPDKGDHEDSTFPQLAAQGRLYGYKSDAYWRTVDTVKDLLEASKELQPS